MNFERINSPYSEPACALVMPMPVHFLRGCKSVPSWCANSIFHGLADLVLPVFVMRQMAQLYGDGAPYAGPNGGSPVPPGDALPEYDTNVLFVMDGSIDVTSGQMKGPLVASLSRYDCQELSSQPSSLLKACVPASKLPPSLLKACLPLFLKVLSF